MSHELRTPLTAILGMGNAELLQADTPERRCRMQVLVQATEGLSVMLDDILDLSAVEAGQLPIRPRPMDLRAEVISIVDTYRQQALDAGLVLRCTLHESLPAYASLDGQRLRQCLSNLLSNAVKHTQAGMISVYAYEVHPGTLAFKVTDTGPGVAEELRDRIFEPFYRGPHNLPGTGLGMAISRTLARRMGGDLTLVPSATGAHFLLLLNYAPATVDDLPPRRTPQAGDLAGLRVLVVDDIATNRLVAATYLRLLGAEPVEAASGTAALAEVQGTRPPDIILLDLLMPDMDGPATLRALAQLETTGRHIPVIAMSADIIDQSRQDDLGRFDGFLRKPLGPETLAEVLAPFAAPRGQGNPPDPPSDRPAKSPD